MYCQIELENAIRKLVSLQLSEKEVDALVDELSRNILDPQWMEYIFHTNEFCDEKGELNLEAVCEKILSYKPILL